MHCVSCDCGKERRGGGELAVKKEACCLLSRLASAAGIPLEILLRCSCNSSKNNREQPLTGKTVGKHSAVCLRLSFIKNWERRLEGV